MVVLQQAKVFLIYVESTRKSRFRLKNKMPGEPIFAEDVLLHNRFSLDVESINHNPDYSKIEVNDYFIVYCSSLVPHSPNQIKFIFQVSSKVNNQFVVKLVKKLNRGYSLKHIISLVDEGKLTKNFHLCNEAKQKICQIEFSDLELLINYDPIVRTYHSTSWKN
jgi:hypothetical protein